MYIASFAWVCLVLGYSRRHDLKQHIPLVAAGIILDILLVLYLQFTRSAIQTALGFSLGPLQQIHIGFSTIALLLYFPTMYLGYKLKTDLGNGELRGTHKKVAISSLIFRTLGFLFMFSMWKH